MKTVQEVSKITGVSVRTLHYYDQIGLLKPAKITEAGYRIYEEEQLERLQSILIYRELKFSLKDIKAILDSSAFDRDKMLEQQIKLLQMQKEHLENLIVYATEIKSEGAKSMDFSVFDTKKMDEYAAQAKERWGETEAYKEYEIKSKGRTREDNSKMGQDLMALFTELGKIKDMDPSSETAQTAVKKIQEFITANYYTCTKEIFKGLGMMYAAGGSMTDNIDKAGGKGTAEFASKAIEIYCEN